VRDIHDLRVRIDSQDHPFHHSHKVIIDPVIRRQRNDWICQVSLPPLFGSGHVFAEWGGTRTFDAIGPRPANQACPLAALRKRQCSSRKFLSTDVSHGVGKQSSAYFLSSSLI
jgi:hypothetical protein